MPKLFIDNREVEVSSGATILDAAEKLGIEIPTMCFLKGYKASTSCMVCVVKVEGLDSLVPACGTLALDGMRVQTASDQVLGARRAALELLLSDHLGDCIGPCQATCPARMNIPLMIRQIAAGELRDAIATVKKDIALPAVLGRICPAPCERACRRAVFDEPVSICLLKRYVADVDLLAENPYSPTCKPLSGKRVAIIGAGPAGLAAGYYLRQDGFDCTLFDDHEEPGGMLRYAVGADDLPREVLDKEIALIEKLGVKFQGQTRMGIKKLTAETAEPAEQKLESKTSTVLPEGILRTANSAVKTLSLKDLRSDFDAVFVAVGELKPGDAELVGLETGPSGIKASIETYQTNISGVFAGGDAVRKRRLAVRAVADGKEAAVSIGQYLSGGPVTGPTKPFNTHIGRLKNGELETFMVSSSPAARPSPSADDGGFTHEDALASSARCLHCDCRKAQSCKLRRYAQQYQARTSRYKPPRSLAGGERRGFEQHLTHPDVIYEPGKCIRCGLCIQIAAEHGEKLGLTFIGRGFDVRVAVPFDRSLAEGLKNAAEQCVNACPTGALAFKNEKPPAK